MSKQPASLDETSISLLRKIVEASLGTYIDVKAVKFRADNHQHRGLIDSLVASHHIEERDGKYFVTLTALYEIGTDVSQVVDLLSWCECLFKSMRQNYFDFPGEEIKVNALVELTSLTKQQIAICVPYMSEASILGGWTNDLNVSNAFVKPAERILDYESFAQIIEERHKWVVSRHEESKTTAIKVFVSYSHDSPEHKRWVTEFSSNLVKNGIDVILDQWDLGLGDDVPKFMEKSVSCAGRVLMICTESYVHKADDGKGGVGYEAMIVTGELVRNLGTSKFIPVLRQKTSEKLLPKSVATRFYVDMSLDDQGQFELLLRELHQAPAIEKPALGKNPFAKSPAGEELPATSPLPLQLEMVTDPASTYASAIIVARSGDILQWRELTRNARKNIGPRLASWRAKYPNPPATIETLVDQTLEGICEFAPLISIALAGIGSGRERFSNQLSLLDEILNPKDWSRGGLVIVTDLPVAAAFVYQSLHGAMCLYTEQINPAIEMIRSNYNFPDWNDPIPIWKNHKVMGWPTSFGGNSEHAWNALVSLPDRYPWVAKIFGDTEDFLAALVAYYLALNINEYAYVLKEGQENLLEKEKMRLDVPLTFLKTSEEVKRRAYNLLLQNQDQIKHLWLSLEVTDEKFASHWDKWIALCSNWLTSSGDYWLSRRLVHSNLPKDLHIV